MINPASVEGNIETLYDLYKGHSKSNMTAEITLQYNSISDDFNFNPVQLEEIQKKSKSDKKGKEVEYDESIVIRDHFGFYLDPLLFDTYQKSFDIWMNQKTVSQIEYYNSNIVKFISALDGSFIQTKEILGFCKAGIPLAHRYEMWLMISGARNYKNKNPHMYRRLLDQHLVEKSITIESIETDLYRTFVNNPLLSSQKDIDRLKRVLVAFSFFEGSPGYCQSVNFVAAFFLLLYDEEESFWLLYTLVKDYLPDYYSSSLMGFKTDSQVFEMLLKQYFPDISDMLFKLGLPIALCTAPWFMCLFINILPIETVMRIFDWLFSEGGHILFSIGLSLFDLNYKDLKSIQSFDDACRTLHNIPLKGFNPDELFDIAIKKFRMEKEEIMALRMKYRIENRENNRMNILRESQLTEEEFNRLIEAFEMNSDSETKDTISKSKFESIFNQILPDLPREISSQVFDALDEDHDNLISSNEFLIGVASLSKGDINKKAKLWFKIFDKEGNGWLSMKDLKKMFDTILKMIDRNLDSSWMNELYSTFEANHGGKVRYEEFISTLESIPVIKDWIKVENQTYVI